MQRRSFGVLLAALAVALTPSGAYAQTPKVGTILIAHGADAEWNSKVETVAGLARTGGPIEVSYLMGDGATTHRFQDAARNLVSEGATEIVVVPLLVSSYSGHYDQIRYLTGQTDSIDAMMMHHLHMSGIAKLRWNCTMVKPSPLLAANISLMTIRMMPMDSACRSPAKICGLAERSTTCRSRAAPVRP